MSVPRAMHADDDIYPSGKPSPLWRTPAPSTAQPCRSAGDLIQASRPERSDSAPGSSEGGSMLGKLAALRTTSVAASAAKEAEARDAHGTGAEAAHHPDLGM